MTLAAARAELRPLGIVLTHQDGEYRVNFKGGAESSAYYTGDLDDAVATGRAMARAHEAARGHVPARRTNPSGPLGELYAHRLASFTKAGAESLFKQHGRAVWLRATGAATMFYRGERNGPRRQFTWAVANQASAPGILQRLEESPEKIFKGKAPWENPARKFPAKSGTLFVEEEAPGYVAAWSYRGRERVDLEPFAALEEAQSYAEARGLSVVYVIENPGRPGGGARRRAVKKELFGARVLRLEYEHVDDPRGVARRHDFGTGVQMFALTDGTVQLRHKDPRKRVWADLPDPERGR